MALLSFTFLIRPWRLRFTDNKICVIDYFVPPPPNNFHNSKSFGLNGVRWKFVGHKALSMHLLWVYKHLLPIIFVCFRTEFAFGCLVLTLAYACLTSVYVFLAISSKHVCIIKALVPNNDGLSCMYVL